ncbi:hypothetical protein AB4454_18190 [Vibrio artabrorum]|uniref:hypothetical protein n=1 Tax=Vibrio artabrorum TaxID=446374 RepID=UPI00354B6DD8
MLFLLSLGFVNTNGYSFLSQPFNMDALQETSSVSQLCKQAGIDDSSAYLECEKVQLGGSALGDRSHYHDSKSSLQATTYRRLLLNEQESGADLEPAYHLLIDFSPPSLLASLLFNTPLLDSKQHWTSMVSSPSSRLSGWKEGNIQYSHFRELLS